MNKQKTVLLASAKPELQVRLSFVPRCDPEVRTLFSRRITLIPSLVYCINDCLSQLTLSITMKSCLTETYET